MFPELSLCINGQESEYPFSVNAYESEYSKFDESRNINESGTLSFSVNLVSKEKHYTNSKKMTNNKRLLVTICFANWNIKCSIISQFSTFRPWWKQTS